MPRVLHFLYSRWIGHALWSRCHPRRTRAAMPFGGARRACPATQSSSRSGECRWRARGRNSSLWMTTSKGAICKVCHRSWLQHQNRLDPSCRTMSLRSGCACT
jgi:hypothetical protein